MYIRKNLRLIDLVIHDALVLNFKIYRLQLITRKMHGGVMQKMSQPQRTEVELLGIAVLQVRRQVRVEHAGHNALQHCMRHEQRAMRRDASTHFGRRADLS